MIRPRQTMLCLEAGYYLVVMAFILAGAMLREINLLIALFGMMLGPLLYNWRHVVVSLKGLSVQRKTPEGIRAGDLMVVDIEVTNERRGVGTWSLIVEDTIRRVANGGREKPATAGVFFAHIPSSAVRRCAYQGRLARRGQYRFGPLRLSTRFPLGLVRRTVELDQTSLLTVYPRLGRLTINWTRRFGEAAHGSRRATRQKGLMEGDYHGLREYRSGDSRRWIHWRTSARRGELMVREFEQQRNQDLCLLLELWQPAEPSERDLENVELAVSFAATAMSDRCRRGGSFLLAGMAAHDVSFTRGPASSALLQELMEQMALAEATADDHLPQLLNTALDSIRPGTSVVLITTRPTDLTDRTRFARLWADSRKKAWAGRIMTIDSSSPQISKYFLPE